MTKPKQVVNVLVLNEVEKSKVEQHVRYLIKAKSRTNTIWWVGTFHWSRERIDKEYKEVFGSESCGLSFVSLDNVDAVYTLPQEGK